MQHLTDTELVSRLDTLIIELENDAERDAIGDAVDELLRRARQRVLGA